MPLSFDAPFAVSWFPETPFSLTVKSLPEGETRIIPVAVSDEYLLNLPPPGGYVPRLRWVSCTPVPGGVVLTYVAGRDDTYDEAFVFAYRVSLPEGVTSKLFDAQTNGVSVFLTAWGTPTGLLYLPVNTFVPEIRVSRDGGRTFSESMEVLDEYPIGVIGVWLLDGLLIARTGDWDEYVSSDGGVTWAWVETSQLKAWEEGTLAPLDQNAFDLVQNGTASSFAEIVSPSYWRETYDFSPKSWWIEKPVDWPEALQWPGDPVSEWAYEKTWPFETSWPDEYKWYGHPYIWPPMVPGSEPTYEPQPWWSGKPEDWPADLAWPGSSSEYDLKKNPWDAGWPRELYDWPGFPEWPPTNPVAWHPDAHLEDDGPPLGFVIDPDGTLVPHRIPGLRAIVGAGGVMSFWTQFVSSYEIP